MVDGLLPGRDGRSHARLMGTTTAPDMPGAWNEQIKDVSKRSALLTVTRAERLAMQPADLWPGLHAVDTDYLEDGLLRYSGAGWKPIDAMPRAWQWRRADDPSANGVIGDTLIAGKWQRVVNGRIPGARPGAYSITAVVVADADPEVVANIRVVANDKSVGDDPRTDLYPSLSTITFPFFLTNHPGGDLSLELWARAGSGDATIRKHTTRLVVTYLGRT